MIYIFSSQTLSNRGGQITIENDCLQTQISSVNHKTRSKWKTVVTINIKKGHL